ncbi:alpha/beta hydrolase [soil metagenome]
MGAVAGSEIEGVEHLSVDAGGLRMHVAVAGEGPLVLLCHGFPECWWSWRHQLRSLAAAGYRVAAPDLRGYGRTGRPAEVSAYTQLHLVGDLVALLAALGEERAIVVGHDWGAVLAWHAALLRPDRFDAVAALSVPYSPRGRSRPTAALKALSGERFNYLLHFQEPGVAEAEAEADARSWLLGFYNSASGIVPPRESRWGRQRKGAALLDAFEPLPDEVPAWLGGDEGLDVFAGEFERTGFTGGLNWYRNLDRNWELLAPFAGAPVIVPALFVAGDRDGVVAVNRAAVDALPQTVPGLRDTLLLEGCGHWTQQERPAEVDAALLGFLADLPGR